MFTRVLGWIQDHPLIINVAIFVFVGGHIAFQQLDLIENHWAFLGDSADSGTSIYLGAASAAAIVAGFAGVVVVFGLTASGQRFRQLRVSAGASLTRNWTSTSISGFGAAGLSLAAATMASSPLGWLSPWLFEVGVLLLIHGTTRIIWLLRQLIKAVARDDEEADKEANTYHPKPEDFE